jgi:hypothetical protein
MKERTEGSLPPRQRHERSFSELRTSALVNGIEDGTITSPSAVRVLIGKQLVTERQIYSSEHRREIEQRYSRLIKGDPQGLTEYCQQRADRAMTFGSPVASDSTDRVAAKHWYEMAARFAHATAGTENLSNHSPMMRETRTPTDGVIFNGSGKRPIETASNILDGIENGSITDPDAVRNLSSALFEINRQTLRGNMLMQQDVAPTSKNMTQLCVSEATSRMGSDVPGSLHVDQTAAARWYEMAARLANKAQRDETHDSESPSASEQDELQPD